MLKKKLLFVTSEVEGPWLRIKQELSVRWCCFTIVFCHLYIMSRVCMSVALVSNDGRLKKPLREPWWTVCKPSDYVWCQWWLMSDVQSLMADVWCLMSHVLCLMSDVWCLMSCVRCPMSDVRCPMSDDWRPMSVCHVDSFVPNVIFSNLLWYLMRIW